MIDIDDLEKIMQVVDKYDISRFEFQHEKSKLIIEKGGAPRAIVKDSSIVQANYGYEECSQPQIKENSTDKADDLIMKTEVEKDSIVKLDSNTEYIKSSFAGTFYSKKESDGPAFVKLYDKVKENTVVGLLEVMKLFNEVEAGVEGRIANILVSHGEFVEYGQPLFEIEVGEKYV